MNQIAAAHLLHALEEKADGGFWPGEGPAFTRESLDGLLVWAYRLGASDIRLQTNTPVFIQLHGRMCQATSRGLTQSELEEAVNRLYGADGQARLKGGSDFDVSYEVRPDLVGHVEVAAALEPGLAVRAVEPVDRLLQLGLREAARGSLAHPAMKLDEDWRVGLQPDVGCAQPVGPDQQTIEALARERRTLPGPEPAVGLLLQSVQQMCCCDLVHGFSLSDPSTSPDLGSAPLPLSAP